jgi:hypothetical protein
MASISGDITNANINQITRTGQQWSEFPATQSVDFSSQELLNCGVIHWSSFNPPLVPGGEGLFETLEISNDASLNPINNLAALSFGDPNEVNENINIKQIPDIGNSLVFYADSDILTPLQPTTDIYCGGIFTTLDSTFKGTVSMMSGLNVGSGTTGISSNINLDGALIINEDGPPINSTTLTAGTVAGISNSLIVSGSAKVSGSLYSNATFTSGLSLLPSDGYKFVGLNAKSVGAFGTGSLILTNNSAIPSATANLECNNITCNQLNYTSLNPPITPGGGENLSQTLTIGNNATGQNITNVGNLFAASFQGTAINGGFQIGNNPLNNYTNDDGAGTPQLTLGFCNLNMGGSKIINLNDPTSSDEPATKNYVDNKPQSGTLYIDGTPWAINVSITNSGSIQSIYNSGPFAKSSGISQQLLITFHNSTILSGPNYRYLITGLVDISPDNSTWTPSTIDPYGTGFLFSPDFQAWITIPPSWTTYYFRIRGSQTNTSVSSYPITANIMVASWSS